MQSIHPHDLDRFLQAQQVNYDQALRELQVGCKRSHWMWYVFPQFKGLGESETAQRYAIQSVAEATAYLAHPVLGQRLLTCCEALLAVEGRSAQEIFGSPDDWKLKSCMTLFASITAADSVFHQVLDRYFQGRRDQQTLRYLQAGKSELETRDADGAGD